ncbi:MAG: phospholipase D-like domain-containing protein [Candidatus Kariarchaeaceae archaeon]
MFVQEFENWKFPRFLQGLYLKTALTGLTAQAKANVRIMVPYLIQSELLHSILSLPDHVAVELLTRSHSGYLPNIKAGAEPALSAIRKRENVTTYINNKIHAKIWLIDTDFAIIHSMNGTPRSEASNFEAGIVSIDKDVILETAAYLDFVRNQSERL